MSVKHKRDSAIRKIFTKHNLGPVPDAPFTDDVAMNLTNRTKARLSNLENDLQEKKVTILHPCILEFIWKSKIFHLNLLLILFGIVLNINISGVLYCKCASFCAE